MKFSQFGALPDFKSNTIPEDPSVRKWFFKSYNES
jgi:hypothetical protein